MLNWITSCSVSHIILSIIIEKTMEQKWKEALFQSTFFPYVKFGTIRSFVAVLQCWAARLELTSTAQYSPCLTPGSGLSVERNKQIKICWYFLHQYFDNIEKPIFQTTNWFVLCDWYITNHLSHLKVNICHLCMIHKQDHRVSNLSF